MTPSGIEPATFRFVAQRFKRSSHFIEPELSVTCWQEPAIGLYLDPDESIPHCTIIIEIFKVGTFMFMHHVRVCIFFCTHMPHALPISFCLTWSFHSCKLMSNKLWSASLYDFSILVTLFFPVGYNIVLTFLFLNAVSLFPSNVRYEVPVPYISVSYALIFCL